MKVAVITALSGSCAPLPDPLFRASWIDYIAFTDSGTGSSPFWNYRPLPAFSFDRHYFRRRNAKLPKVLPEVFLADYDYYIWQDSTHRLVGDPSAWIERLSSVASATYSVFRHEQRDCVYSEADVVKEARFDLEANVNAQIKYYLKLGFPRHFGLFELPLFIKKKSPSSLAFSLSWWEQICRFSSRDQLSFPFIVWSAGTTIDVIEDCSVNKNPWFERVLEHKCVRKLERSWLEYKMMGIKKRIRRSLGFSQSKRSTAKDN
jgi:hypothetical protein